jgi:hypothetical protein
LQGDKLNFSSFFFYLKKEEIIKLLQEKIRMTKANLFQANEQQNLKNLNMKNEKNDSGIDIDGVLCGNTKNTCNSTTVITGITNDFDSSNENFTSLQNFNGFQIENKMKSNRNCTDIDSSTCTTNTTSKEILNLKDFRMLLKIFLILSYY